MKLVLVAEAVEFILVEQEQTEEQVVVVKVQFEMLEVLPQEQQTLGQVVVVVQLMFILQRLVAMALLSFATKSHQVYRGQTWQKWQE